LEAVSDFAPDETLMPYAIPAGLDRKQRRFLTGIRYCIDFINISYASLVDDALVLFDPTKELLSNSSNRALRTKMFFNAWALVDNVNRLRRLVHFSGMEMPDAVQLFVDGTSDFNTLRQIIQHPDKDYAKDDTKIVASNILGSLFWNDYRSYREGHDNTRVVVCQIHAGANATTERKQTFEAKIDRFPITLASNFRLSAFGTSGDLSVAHSSANQAIKSLADAYEKGWTDFISAKAAEGVPISETALERLAPDWAAADVLAMTFAKAE
jgi:hypothetical protein